MSTPSASRSEAGATRAPILVWDAPVRVFHWLMVLCFAGAWLTAESERWRLLHVSLGYTMAGLVGFRLLWGVVGTRHARFASFLRGPAAVARYVSALAQGRPEHHVGHNPAGALAIMALLGLSALIVLTGWATYNEVALPWPEKWSEELHEGAASVMLALVGVHVLAVIASGRLHGENLVRAMFTGRKPGTPEQAIRSAWASVAVLMLVAVLGFWAWQWQSAPSAQAAQAAQTAQGEGAKLGTGAQPTGGSGRREGHHKRGHDDDD